MKKPPKLKQKLTIIFDGRCCCCNNDRRRRACSSPPKSTGETTRPTAAKRVTGPRGRQRITTGKTRATTPPPRELDGRRVGRHLNGQYGGHRSSSSYFSLSKRRCRQAINRGSRRRHLATAPNKSRQCIYRRALKV